MKAVFQFFKNAFSGIPIPIWWLSVGQLINRIGAMAVPFMTLYLTQKLQFSIAEAGFVMTFFGLGSILGAFLGGRAADVYGYQKTMFATLLLSGFGFLAMIPMRNFWAISATIFVLSVTLEAFRPANSVSITKFSSPELRTRSLALYRMAVNLGWAVASALGGWLAGLDYSLIFWVDGLTSIIATVFLLFFFKKYREVSAETEAQKVEKQAEKSAQTSVWKDKNYLIFVLLTWVGAMIFMQHIWTVPTFLKEIYHFDETTIGLIMGLNGLIVVLFELPLIFAIEKRRPMLWFVRLGFLLYGMSFLIYLPEFWPLLLAILSIISMSFGETFVMPFSSSFVTKYAPESRQGQYFALYTAAYSISNVLAPLVGTQIITHFGYRTLWFCAFAAAVSGMAGVNWLAKKTSKLALSN